MSLTHFYYDPFTEFDRLFDDAFISRFRPGAGVTDPTPTSRSDIVFRPRCVLLLRIPVMVVSLRWMLTIFVVSLRLDLQENPDTNTVTAKFELPGINPNDVRVEVQNDRLTVGGETTVSETREEGDYVVRERSCGKFSRTLSLSPGTKVRAASGRNRGQGY